MIEFTNFIAEFDSALFQGIDTNEISVIYKDLSCETDRNAVIVAISIIDDILSSKIKSLLTAGTSKDHNALFSDNGPFSSMYSKVEWLYCIGELNENTRRDINLLRKMRNDAAHIWRKFILDNDKYACNLEKMNAFQSVTSLKRHFAEKESVSIDSVKMSPRVCFNLMTSLIIIQLGDKSADKIIKITPDVKKSD